MNELELKKVFSLQTFAEKEEKAYEILEQVDGVDLIDKLKTLSEIAFTFTNIKNKETRDFANRYRNQVVSVRTALTRRGKEIRDNINLFIKEEQKQEKEYLNLFLKGEKTLKEKIDEYDRIVAREERRDCLPIRLKMLQEIGLEMSEDDILDLDDKKFGALYYEKKAEHDQKIENERLIELEEKHKERFSILVEKDLFQFVDNKLQKFSELSENDFLILVENCEKRKAVAEQERQIEIEKAGEEALEIENKEYQKKQEQEKEKNEKDARFNTWKSANSYNVKTDFIKFEDGKATLWRKISIINY